MRYRLIRHDKGPIIDVLDILYSLEITSEGNVDVGNHLAYPVVTRPLDDDVMALLRLGFPYLTIAEQQGSRWVVILDLEGNDG